MTPSDIARWKRLPRGATAQEKPWTRWWWLGSAVDEAGITQHLTRFRSAGFGGVEVSPIYAAQGDEARAVPYLSPRWIALLDFTLAEARRLGLGVDLICGTGWPFGGPSVTGDDAAQKVRFAPFGAGEPVAGKPGERMLASQRVGQITHAAFISGTGQQVKRAGPGGEGAVLDHFDRDALGRYLAHLDDGLRKTRRRPHCFFNDSWEVYGADVTPGILARFAADHGYRLEDEIAAWAGAGDPERSARVRCDYRTTLEGLIRDDFLGVWQDWARQRGAKTRNQAHGSPGNLLDLYAAADIPETECFGPAVLALNGLAPLTDIPRADRQTAEEELLVCRLAASAGRVAGRPLASSESFTWLGEHGQTPLEHLKAEADLLFTAGINHVFYHGSPYSPEDAPWPGRLFYASTHFGPTNPFWADLPAFHAYLTRCQSLLQSGVGDGDFLVYFPVWDQRGAELPDRRLLQPCGVHNTAEWLRAGMPGLAALATTLRERGYAFDLVSDRLLATSVRAEGGQLRTAGAATYRALLVPGARSMPPETLERLADLADAGVPVLFPDGLPVEVPGLADRPARKARLDTAGRRLRGAVRPVESVALPRVAAGLRFTRRRIDGDLLYFLLNASESAIDQDVTLPGDAASALVLDPLTGESGTIPFQRERGALRMPLRLEPGETRFVRLCARPVAAPAWTQTRPSADATPLSGPWEVTGNGRHSLNALSDWTGWDAAWRAYSGSAVYRTVFDAPEGARDGFVLELGRVCHSAQVRLNGRELGTVFARPWRLPLPPLKRRGNVLEITVTNLMANRLAELDRRKAPWKRFFLVDIRYRPFDASAWPPLPSGLLGPVQLRRG